MRLKKGDVVQTNRELYFRFYGDEDGCKLPKGTKFKITDIEDQYDDEDSWSYDLGGVLPNSKRVLCLGCDSYDIKLIMRNGKKFDLKTMFCDFDLAELKKPLPKLKKRRYRINKTVVKRENGYAKWVMGGKKYKIKCDEFDY